MRALFRLQRLYRTGNRRQAGKAGRCHEPKALQGVGRRPYVTVMVILLASMRVLDRCRKYLWRTPGTVERAAV